MTSEKQLGSDRLCPPPPGWGDDSLSDFLETAYRNRWATFHNKEDWYRRLAEIDECFMRIAKGWTNPQNMVAPLFFLRSHAAYRAACEHALAGQIADVFPQLRACLEYAGYGLHIDRNESLAETWLRRHDDDVAMRAVKNEFQIAKVRTTIRAANQHIEAVFGDLYERSIDFGGHPNERAITGSLKIIEHDGHKEFQSVYLHDDDLALVHGMKTVAQGGLCALEIFRDVFSARFELLGVTADILELRKGL